MDPFHHEPGHEDGSDDTDTVVCGMDMSLHWGACETILVRSWQANTVGKFVAVAIGFFLLAIVYEGLKYYREVLFIQSQELRKRIVKDSNGHLTTTVVNFTVKEQMLNVPHFVQTFLHLLQVFISYILMLIVMLCNFWLIIAICVGAAFGYFIFGWLRKVTFIQSDCCY